MVSVNNLETDLNIFSNKCHQVEQYKSAHLEIIGLNEDPSALSEMEANYDSALKNFAEFKTRMDEYVAKANEQIERATVSTTLSRSFDSKLRDAQFKRAKAQIFILNCTFYYALRVLKTIFTL